MTLLLWLRGLLGRYLSVRMKLTLWYGFMCAATLGITGFAMKTFLDAQFSTDIDGSLRRTAAAVQSRISGSSIVVNPDLTAYGNGPCSSRLDPPLFAYCVQIRNGLFAASGELTASGQFEQVLLTTNAAGTLLPIGQPGLNRGSLPGISPLTLVRVASLGRPLFQDSTYRSESLRLYLSPLDMPGNLRSKGYAGVVEVVQNKQTYNQIRQRFDLMLLLGVPLGVLIALLAGWWIARAALRPINRVSRTMRAIGDSKDLTRRLHSVGPLDEVGRLAETFDRMMNRLENAFENQKRFIADASHELRTPLTAIRGNADLMMIAPAEEREACLSAIRREAERMTRLVSDLLLLAEADVAEQALQLRPVALHELLQEVFRSAQLMSGGKVEVMLVGLIPISVDGDPDRLKQLFLNLVDNAVKFTPKDGTVSISMRRDGDQVRVEVSDSGVGISLEEQEAIFERFYRVETSRSKRGSGLGLSISNWIVQSHGGRITVHSELYKGSTFAVTLPLRAGVAVAAE